MKLTRIQLKLLKFYANYEARPLNLAGIIRPFWVPWLLLLLVAGAGRWDMWAGWPAVGWVLVGVSVGAFLRDVNRILSLFLTWPVLHQVINWQQLKESREAASSLGAVSL